MDSRGPGQNAPLDFLHHRANLCGQETNVPHLLVEAGGIAVARPRREVDRPLSLMSARSAPRTTPMTAVLIGKGCDPFMVEAAGIEPATAGNRDRAKAGQEGPKVGHDGSQVGQVEGVVVCPMCKRRTAAGRSDSRAGRETSTTEAQWQIVSAIRTMSWKPSWRRG